MNFGEGNGNHSSILAWRIPWTEEPGGLVHGVAKNQNDWSDLAHTHTTDIPGQTTVLLSCVPDGRINLELS